MSITATQISHKIWCTFVGSSLRIPDVNSYVYYFPQGYLENVFIDNYEGIHPSPLIPCRILSLDFFCCPRSGEPFVKLRLQQIDSLGPNASGNEIEYNNNQIGILTSSWKILSPSDTNNSGTFSVPKSCAKDIFPPLNYSEDTPKQDLYVKDACNIEWKLRQIYRVSQSRHLLTSNWNNFVTQKRLVVGDSVVFIKRTPLKEEEELFIGIKRKSGFAVFKGTDVGDTVERRVLVAIGNATRITVFEVDYHPMAGLFPAFVVSVDKVEASKLIPWGVGMRVKISLPTHDSTSYEGRIVAVHSHISNQWPQSPWRKLQVSWDDSRMTTYMNYVSPWEVEPGLPSPLPHPFSVFPPYKKVKLDNGEGPSSSRLTESHPNDDVSFTELLTRDLDNETKTVSAVFHIGCSNPSRSSNDSQSIDNISPTRDSGMSSFRLFGNDIQPVPRNVSENAQPNSSYNNNRKGKNVAYDE